MKTKDKIWKLRELVELYKELAVYLDDGHECSDKMTQEIIEKEDRLRNQIASLEKK